MVHIYVGEPHVAIIDPSPMFVARLTKILRESMIVVDEVTDPIRWAHGPGRRAVVLRLADSEGLDLAAALDKSNPSLATVGVVESSDAKEISSALTSGVCAVLPRDSAPETFVLVIAAALEGFSVAPRTVASQFREQVVKARRSLSGEDAAILRSLARGDSVANIANALGYSVRQTHRMLRALYRRIGVDNRIAAVVRATQWGLSEKDPQIRIDIRAAEGSLPTPRSYRP